ncbi:MAG TPA: hypothetical protein VFR58_13330 [Flavisolibacter sp.]|nr:hypothetical protein [Flavisolibacter sp.]
MQLSFRYLCLPLTAAILFLGSCKKDDNDDNDQDVDTPDPATEVAVHSSDQNRVSSDIDMAVNDATTAMESSASFSGARMMNLNSICNALATADTSAGQRKITIAYNGNNCAGTHHRSGTVTVSMPTNTRWKNAGAVITLTYQDLKVRRLSDNTSITINGALTLTNVSGGLLINLSQASNIIHELASSSMTISFDNNTQRVWQVARKKVYSYNNGIVLTVTGNHTIGSNTQVAEWGTNRFGRAFTTSITQPVVIRQDCSFRVTAGEIKHEGFATATATFGLDASANPTGCPGAGTYFMKITWIPPIGNPQSVILPY